MSRDNRSLGKETLHNLHVAKWWTRIIVYPAVTLLVPIDVLFLHFPLFESVLSHTGGFVVATLGIELGFSWGERIRRQSDYPNLLLSHLGSPTDLRDACQTALRTVVELLNVDSALVVVLQRNSLSPEMILDYGAPPGTLKFDAGGMASLRRYCKCIQTRSLHTEPVLPSHPLFSVFGSGRCLVYVPIVCLDKVIGVLTIVGPRKRAELKDRTLLKRMGEALGLLLDNVRLYSHEHQAILHILTSALDQRDGVTEGHSRRVADLSLIVARELGVQGEELLDMERAGILHDIGKLAVPDAILSKPGPLTTDEWVEMRRHPDVGYQMVRDVPFLDRAAEIIRSHHERFDGDGYPRNLKGEHIPLGARIFAVVDAYDAMTSDRPYRLALTHEEALDEIRQQAGSQFDPVIVAPFFAAVRKGFISPGMPVNGHKPLLGGLGGNGSTPSPEEAHVPAS